jgi:RNA polymerase sigma factor (sigma-70 family)
MPEKPGTNPTIFLRLLDVQAAPREIAWREFHDRYAPVVRAYGLKLGIGDAEADDVVQEVMLGFFSRAPTFVYDPAKGRFRSYLRTCAAHAARHRLQKSVKYNAMLEDQDLTDESADPAWEDLWEKELLRHTLAILKRESGQTKAFKAFERYVMFEHDAAEVARELDMHINSVYRAKEQIIRDLQVRLEQQRLEGM